MISNVKRLISANTKFNANELSALRSDIESACHEWLINNGFPEVKESKWDLSADDMAPSIWMSDHGGMLKVEVGMELGYNSLLDLAFNYLDPLIVKYDKNAYFDMADAGLMVAYLDN